MSAPVGRRSTPDPGGTDRRHAVLHRVPHVPHRASHRETPSSLQGPLHRVLRSHAALWTAFAAVHGWLAVLGVAVMPARAFWDVDLYRYWAALALDAGRWPVLDDAWVYPAGALAPVLAPALSGARTTAGYATGWCLLVTLLDAVAVAVLLRRAGTSPPRGAWWWLAFVLALGPVAMGRLDAVVAPLCVVALAVAARRPALASALLTVGAWVKVAPGALLLPLVAVVHRPLRDVVAPAAAVCAVVVGAVAAGGGLPRIASFLTEQTGRDLQVESVAATPWVLAGLVDDRVRIAFDRRLVTWEIHGPGTAVAAGVLDVALPVALAGLGLLLLRAARAHRGARGAAARSVGRADPREVLLWGALAAAALLLVLNKVGSPQLVGWLAAPVVVALSPTRPRPADAHAAPSTGPSDGTTDPSWRPVAGGVLVVAALTQAVFPFGADGVVGGDPLLAAVLAARNVGLMLVLAVALRRLRRATTQPARSPFTSPAA